MSMAFLFWLSALYTLALFGIQVAEFASAGRFSINAGTANAFYLALLSTYVGSKEIQRWKGDLEDPSAGATGFRLKGEWFVGLWAVSLLAAVLGSEIWPKYLAYPKNLTLIAFEVLGFYIGSSASKWLKQQKEYQAHEELQRQLEAEGVQAESASNAEPRVTPGADQAKVPAAPRVSRKRERYEEQVLGYARSNAGITREQAEKLLNISRAAANRLLASMFERSLLRREGQPGDPTTRYRPTE